ncbi:MAG: blue (type 1) copper domain protein [Cyanobacteria bacterium RYN_339]|nr:blue (type 1) copper domain protein [Cyanobacteria bacterium RYN_339]
MRNAIWLACAATLLVPAPAFAKLANERTPTQEGTFIAPAGTAFFSFAHRFTVGASPSYSVANVPTFHLSAGVLDWAALGALYSTETATVPGASQELELFAKERFLDEGAGALLSASLKEAYNMTSQSADLEASLSKRLGPVTVFGTARGMSNFQYSGQMRAVGGLGLAFSPTPYLALVADASASPMRAATEPPVAWGAGVQIQIPSTPHTLALHATNTGSTTIQGSSVATDTVRYGFDFTIPFSNAKQWTDIVMPEQPAPTPAAGATFDAKAFFTGHCIACHGPLGAGGFGPDLRPVEAKGDDFIRNRIKTGSPKGMPPFASQLSPADLDALVAFVKSL